MWETGHPVPRTRAGCVKGVDDLLGLRIDHCDLPVRMSFTRRYSKVKLPRPRVVSSLLYTHCGTTTNGAVRPQGIGASKIDLLHYFYVIRIWRDRDNSDE